MEPFVKELVQLANRTAKEPALVVKNPKDRAAYTQAMVDSCVEVYAVQEQSRRLAMERELKALSADDDSQVQQIDAVSRASLVFMRDELRQVAEANTQGFSPEVIAQMVKEAKALCKSDNLSATHQTNFLGSTTTREEREAAGDLVKKSKKLVALHYLNPVDYEDANTVVYMAVAPKGKPDKHPHYLLQDIPGELMDRSCMLLEGQNQTEAYLVGGKHFEAAWLLRTISKAFQGPNLKAQDIPAEGMEDYVHQRMQVVAGSVLGDLRVPREVNLEGHYFVQDGEKEKIEPLRAEKKPPVQKKEIAPGHKDLKRQPRVRAKTDEE